MALYIRTCYGTVHKSLGTRLETVWHCAQDPGDEARDSMVLCVLLLT